LDRQAWVNARLVSIDGFEFIDNRQSSAFLQTFQDDMSAVSGHRHNHGVYVPGFGHYKLEYGIGLERGILNDLYSADRVILNPTIDLLANDDTGGADSIRHVWIAPFVFRPRHVDQPPQFRYLAQDCRQPVDLVVILALTQQTAQLVLRPGEVLRHPARMAVRECLIVGHIFFSTAMPGYCCKTS
jgi:hypothetical protein